MLLNRRFDYKPGAIVMCATEQDVAATIGFTRDRHLRISVRAGGTSPGGFSSNDGGVVLDLSRLGGISIDASGLSVRVGTGTLLQPLVEKVGPAGLMVPVGECMPVGLSGLALGGGFGLLSRSLGLTCDNILEARIVTADGKVLQIDAA